MRLHRSLATAALVLLILALPVTAAQMLKVQVDAGVTEVLFADQTVRIETTAPVVVYLEYSDGEVGGSVEPAPGVRTATVTITVLGPPDDVIFDGRVTHPIFFQAILPEETGRGEL